MVVVGAGGHAKVVVELARDNGFDVVGCTDRNTDGPAVVGAPVIGDDSTLAALFASGIGFAAVGLGANALRLKVGRQLQAIGFALPPLVHSSATVSPSVRLGSGVAVMAGAVINAETSVGDFSVVNTRAGVDHEGVIGHGAHIGPGASLSGSVNVGDEAFVGVGATVLPGVCIGKAAMLGGGSVAIRDIPAGATAVGAPARLLTPSGEE